MGDLNTLPLIGTAAAWARMVTGNHTRVQIALGMVIRMISVLIVYGLMSFWRPL